MIDKPNNTITCPYTGHKKKCLDLYTNCPKWVMLVGNNPNTGEPINSYNCADVWLPILLVENSQMQRQTSAAVEALRNAVHNGNQDIMRLAAAKRVGS